MLTPPVPRPPLRRARAGVALAGLCLTAAACGGGGGGGPRSDVAGTGTPAPRTASPSPSPSPLPPPPPELPRGGRSVFPEHEVVAYYGTVQGAGDLGILGLGAPDAQVAKLEAAAAPFGPASGRPVLPALELITTVATRAAGPAGDYSAPLTDAQVQTYLDAARKGKALLVLDLQPGRADLLAQAKRYERFLREPDVGLALDPEWKLQPGQRPGRQIGYVTAAEVNSVSEYVAGLVAQGDLPEKMFVVHQFRQSMIRDRAQLVRRPGLETVVHIDGFGGQELKRQVYGALSAKGGEFVNGFKLFYDEDTDTMTPEQAMAVVPRPELITYQ